MNTKYLLSNDHIRFVLVLCAKKEFNGTVGSEIVGLDFIAVMSHNVIFQDISNHNTERTCLKKQTHKKNNITQTNREKRETFRYHRYKNNSSLCTERGSHES